MRPCVLAFLWKAPRAGTLNPARGARARRTPSSVPKRLAPGGSNSVSGVVRLARATGVTFDRGSGLLSVRVMREGAGGVPALSGRRAKVGGWHAALHLGA